MHPFPSLPPWLSILLLSGSALAQAQSQGPTREQLEHEPMPTTTEDVDESLEYHPSTTEAPAALVELITREPERVVGKTLVLVEGDLTRTVGPVLDVRKRREDQRPYLIVDGSRYFAVPAQFVVAVHHLDRIDGNELITPAYPGMHLRGMEYDADDYEDLPESVVTD
jgi:hypothetical protein